MNIRLQKYKANRLAGMNIYNAARAAGYSHNTANKQGKRIEKLGKVGMVEAFEQAGLTDKAIVQHALEGLTASKGFVIDGKKIPDVEIPEWSVRHKYFETVCKLTNRLKENSLKEIGDALKPIINIINYGSKTNTDPSGSVPTEQVCVRDFGASGPVQEHQLAPQSTQDNLSPQ